MNRHVIGLFYHLEEAENAIEALCTAGVEPGEISLLASKGETNHFEFAEATKLSEGTAAGGVLGGVLGLGAAVMAIGATGGTILAVGPLLIALASLGSGAAVGGIVGALIGVGIPEHEARFYEGEIVERDAVLVGIATLRHDDVRIASLLLQHKAVNITRSG
jgi:hypothetical protein